MECGPAFTIASVIHASRSGASASDGMEDRLAGDRWWSVPPRPADRVKTDKRDAIRLARLLAAGELVLVTIPSVEREQLRDLVRCREDIRVDLARARHRIGGFVLRREIDWEGPGEAWTRTHRSWLTSVRFADHAFQATLADDLHAHDVLIARRDQVEADLAQLAGQRAVRAHGRQASVPTRDRHALRGRAVRGDRRMGALRSSRPALRLPRDRPVRAHHRPATPARSITKAGSTHARRLLVEAAYHDRRGPAVGEAPGRRQRGQPPEIITISWNAQRRHERPLAPTHRRPPQTRRDRHGRDRARARRLLLGDRHLPHHIAGTDTHTNHPHEAHQLTLNPPQPVAAGEAARASPLAHTTPRYLA